MKQKQESPSTLEHFHNQATPKMRGMLTPQVTKLGHTDSRHTDSRAPSSRSLEVAFTSAWLPDDLHRFT